MPGEGPRPGAKSEKSPAGGGIQNRGMSGERWLTAPYRGCVHSIFLDTRERTILPQVQFQTDSTGTWRGVLRNANFFSEEEEIDDIY